jgi:hypothetical protein
VTIARPADCEAFCFRTLLLAGSTGLAFVPRKRSPAQDCRGILLSPCRADPWNSFFGFLQCVLQSVNHGVICLGRVTNRSLRGATSILRSRRSHLPAGTSGPFEGTLIAQDSCSCAFRRFNRSGGITWIERQACVMKSKARTWGFCKHARTYGIGGCRRSPGPVRLHAKREQPKRAAHAPISSRSKYFEPVLQGLHPPTWKFYAVW